MSTTEASSPTAPGGERRADELKLAMTAAWDSGALGYDKQWSHGLKTTTERDAWMALLARLLPSPSSVLDVGTGTGFLALLMSEMGHDVTGVDLSEQMMSVGRAHAEARGMTTRFVVGDAEEPAALGEFDVVISRHLLWTLRRPEQAVRAWSQLLRPGGRVIAIDGLWFHLSVADRAVSEVGRLLTRLRPDREKRGHHYPADADGHLPLKHLRSFEPARNVFVRAGLSDVLAEELAWIDNVERSVMPLDERLRHRYRRYLLEGTTPRS